MLPGSSLLLKFHTQKSEESWIMAPPRFQLLLALLYLLSEVALPTHSLGLRKQQITHTIDDLNQLRQQMALKTSLESSNAATLPRFVQLDVPGRPVESTPTNATLAPPLTGAASPSHPRSLDPFTNSIPADNSTVVSTAAVAPPSFLPNTASLDSASASNFPSQCAQRPKKEPLTAADISCMTKHTSKAHGRYICPLRCPIGSPLSKKGTSCLCGPCWEGTTCQAPKCAHGEEVGCPNHGTHCHHDERTCLCPVKNDGNPSYTGKHCEHKFDPNAISAEEASLEAEKKMQAKEQALKDQQLAAEALISEVCNGMACDGLSMLNTTSCECKFACVCVCLRVFARVCVCFPPPLSRSMWDTWYLAVLTFFYFCSTNLPPLFSLVVDQVFVHHHGQAKRVDLAPLVCHLFTAQITTTIVNVHAVIKT
jgi:hypothetical protein